MKKTVSQLNIVSSYEVRSGYFLNISKNGDNIPKHVLDFGS